MGLAEAPDIHRTHKPHSLTHTFQRYRMHSCTAVAGESVAMESVMMMVCAATRADGREYLMNVERKDRGRALWSLHIPRTCKSRTLRRIRRSLYHNRSCTMVLTRRLARRALGWGELRVACLQAVAQKPVAPTGVSRAEMLEWCDVQFLAATLKPVSACRNPSSRTPSRLSRTHLSHCIHSCNELLHCCAPLAVWRGELQLQLEVHLIHGGPSCATLPCLIHSPRNRSVCSLRHIDFCRCIDNCTAAAVAGALFAIDVPPPREL